MWVVKSAEKFGECGRSTLKKRYFEGMSLVDSNGLIREIEGVCRVEIANPWWKWPVEILMFNSRVLRAAFQLSDPEHIPLDAFKKKVITYIDYQKGMWESGIGVEEIKEEVRKAKTHREVIEVIYGDKIA